MKKCPSCEVIMNEVTKSEVLIDVCPKCMGVWLDKGELEKIIAQSDAYEAQYNNDYRRDNHGFDDDDHYGGHNDKHHDRHSGKVYYDKNGKPIRRRGGFGDILGGLFD